MHFSDLKGTLFWPETFHNLSFNLFLVANLKENAASFAQKLKDASSAAHDKFNILEGAASRGQPDLTDAEKELIDYFGGELLQVWHFTIFSGFTCCGKFSWVKNHVVMNK